VDRRTSLTPDRLGELRPHGPTNGCHSVISITVVNRSDFPVRISNVGVDTQDGSGRTLHLTTPMPGATIPGTIPPHDSAKAYIPKENVEREGIDLYRPVRV